MRMYLQKHSRKCNVSLDEATTATAQISERGFSLKKHILLVDVTKDYIAAIPAMLQQFPRPIPKCMVSTNHYMIKYRGQVKKYWNSPSTAI